MISPFLKVCARPRNDIAAMHHEREIVAGRNIEPDLPADRHEHHDEEDQHQEGAGGISGKQIKPVEKDAHRYS